MYKYFTALTVTILLYMIYLLKFVVAVIVKGDDCVTN